MGENNVLFALGLSLFAGLSTGLGGLFVLLFRRTNPKYLSVALGFSAGVMIFVSFIEIYPEARSRLIAGMGGNMGDWIVLLSFFLGIGLIALIDKLVPEFQNPHEARKIEDVHQYDRDPKKEKLLRTSVMTAIAMSVHNFPEGLATFVSGIDSKAMGIIIAIAVAIHNIPEGIALSVPYYSATGSRKKAFLLSLLSGLAEPLGAVKAWLVLAPFINDTIFGIVFATVAGIMVYISFDELLPTAREYGEHHLSILGLIGGMALMGVSLLIL
ncbi:MAG TPA: zinc transporter ZupT [Thermoclostridium sp.]|nr:zinc transporter ZupT [Thermoclostridium sp.]HPU45793.1 zinc transporter ZupT [Thermoclostridium sp.]